jgi:hypothetical protein
MDEQLYVIVDIHPNDACYAGAKEFLGKMVTIRHVGESPERNGYLSCDVKFVIPIEDKDGHKTKYMFFLAVQLQTLEDNKAENGKLVEP